MCAACGRRGGMCVRVHTTRYEIRLQDFNKGVGDILRTIGHRRRANAISLSPGEINSNRLAPSAEHAALFIWHEYSKGNAYVRPLRPAWWDNTIRVQEHISVMNKKKYVYKE